MNSINIPSNWPDPREVLLELNSKASPKQRFDFLFEFFIDEISLDEYKRFADLNYNLSFEERKILFSCLNVFSFQLNAYLKKSSEKIHKLQDRLVKNEFKLDLPDLTVEEIERIKRTRRRISGVLKNITRPRGVSGKSLYEVVPGFIYKEMSPYLCVGNGYLDLVEDCRVGKGQIVKICRTENGTLEDCNENEIDAIIQKRSKFCVQHIDDRLIFKVCDPGSNVVTRKFLVPIDKLSGQSLKVKYFYEKGRV